MDNIEEYWAKNGYTVNGSAWFMGHENSVVRCTWNNNQDCKDMLVNGMRDFGYCFSFSPSELKDLKGTFCSIFNCNMYCVRGTIISM